MGIGDREYFLPIPFYFYLCRMKKELTYKEDVLYSFTNKDGYKTIGFIDHYYFYIHRFFKDSNYCVYLKNAVYTPVDYGKYTSKTWNYYAILSSPEGYLSSYTWEEATEEDIKEYNYYSNKAGFCDYVHKGIPKFNMKNKKYKVGDILKYKYEDAYMNKIITDCYRVIKENDEEEFYELECFDPCTNKIFYSGEELHYYDQNKYFSIDITTRYPDLIKLFCQKLTRDLYK